MGALLTILLVLFVALAIVVKITEKYGKPMEPEQQSKLWRILIILIFISLFARLIQYWVAG